MIALIKLICVIFFTTPSLQARTLYNVTFDDQVQLADKTLTLNGMGIRKKSVMGFPVKVYVAGLYLEKVSTNSDDILNSAALKQIRMRFLLSVDREKLVEAFGGGYEANCVVACELQLAQVKPLLNHLPNASQKADWLITFFADKVEFEITGSNPKKLEFKSPELSKNLLAVFIHSKAPPTEELRQGLLGNR